MSSTTGRATDGKAVDILAELASLDATAIETDPKKRMEALVLSKKLTSLLEAPNDRAIDYIFKPFSSVAIRMAVGLNLFQHISAASSPISSAQLSALSGGEEALISRILRVVASIDFVSQTEPYKWAANSTTHAMAQPGMAAGYRCDMLTRTAMFGTEFLTETDWRNPSEPRNGFFQYANKTEMHLFEYLASQPSLFADFNLFMGAVGGSQASWWEWYDVQGRLLTGFTGEVLLVDVGGGRGHELQGFNDKFGKGKLVLQDLPGVIDGLAEGALDSSIVRMGSDFFTDQPVQGARTYFLRHILHDWSDKYCLQILKHLHDAMIPGYSKLIINDLVLPDMGASEMQTRFDLAMMTINSGMERSASEFNQLLEKAGFKVTGVWAWPDKDGIVEAEVAQ